MGHDIHALRPGVNPEHLLEQFERGTLDLDELAATLRVAYLRRSAIDPLNQIIYLALGVMDEAYGGGSGKNITVSVSLDQLRTARECLENKSFKGVLRERNQADEFADQLRSSGIPYYTPSTDCDVAREKQFIEDCIDYLELSGGRSVDIVFA